MRRNSTATCRHGIPRKSLICDSCFTMRENSTATCRHGIPRKLLLWVICLSKRINSTATCRHGIPRKSPIWIACFGVRRNSKCTFERSVIIDNQCEDTLGGGIYCYAAADCSFSKKTVIANNIDGDSYEYSGVYCLTSDGTSCATDGTSYITLPCLPGTYGTKTPTIIMTSSNWATQPSSTGTCTSCPAGTFSNAINQTTICFEWSKCGVGEYVSQNGTQIADSYFCFHNSFPFFIPFFPLT